MESVSAKIGDKIHEYRKLSEKERTDLLNEVFASVYKSLSEEEKAPLQAILDRLVVKSESVQHGAIRNFGKVGVLQALGCLGILFAGLSDDSLASIAAIRKYRRRMPQEPAND